MDPSRTCLVIDANPVVRAGIRSMLAPDFDVEELDDGRGALELLTSVGSIDAAVVEMRSGGGGVPSGAATIRDLRGAHPALGVVAYGGLIDRHAVRAALDAGAAAYVTRRSDPAALLEAIEAACEQEGFVDPAADGRGGATLTRRQREVLQAFADGLSTEQAAQRMGISEETVRTHAKASLARLGARDRTHAVAIGFRGNLLE